MNSLGPDALALLRRGKSADEPDSRECEDVVLRARERFEKEKTIDALERAAWPRPKSRRLGAARPGRKLLFWMLAALVSSASVGAWGAWSGALSKWPPLRALWSPEQSVDTEQSADTEGVGAAAQRDLGAKPAARTPQDQEQQTSPPGTQLGTEAADFPSAPSASGRTLPELQPKPELPGPANSEPPREGPEKTSAGGRLPTGQASAASQSHRLPPSATQSASTLALELRLIASARSALATQDYSAALALAEQHALTFPEGQLLPERLAIVALSHCHRNGDRGRARAFVTRYPSSLFAARVSSECGLAPASTEPASTGPEDSSRGSF